MFSTRKFTFSYLGLFFLGFTFSQAFAQVPPAQPPKNKPNNVLSNYKACKFDGEKITCPKKSNDKESYSGYVDGDVPFETASVEFKIGPNAYRVQLPTDHVGATNLNELKEKYKGDYKKSPEFKKQIAEVLKGYSKINTDKQIAILKEKIKKDDKNTDLKKDLESLEALNKFVDDKDASGDKIEVTDNVTFSIPEGTTIWKDKEKKNGAGFASGEAYVEGKYTSDAFRAKGTDIANYLKDPKVCTPEDPQITTMERSNCSAVCTITLKCDLNQAKKVSSKTPPKEEDNGAVSADDSIREVQMTKALMKANNEAVAAVTDEWNDLVKFTDSNTSDTEKLELMKNFDNKGAESNLKILAYNKAIKTLEDSGYSGEAGALLEQAQDNYRLFKTVDRKISIAKTSIIPAGLELPKRYTWLTSATAKDLDPNRIKKVIEEKDGAAADFKKISAENEKVSKTAKEVFKKYPKKPSSSFKKQIEDSVSQSMAGIDTDPAPPTTKVPPPVNTDTVPPEKSEKKDASPPAPSKTAQEVRINLVCAADETDKKGTYKCPDVDKCYHDNKVNTGDEKDIKKSSQRSIFETEATKSGTGI